MITSVEPGDGKTLTAIKVSCYAMFWSPYSVFQAWSLVMRNTLKKIYKNVFVKKILLFTSNFKIKLIMM